jgi:hypothetical protein
VGTPPDIDSTCCFCGATREERETDIPADDGHGRFAPEGREKKKLLVFYGTDKNERCLARKNQPKGTP